MVKPKDGDGRDHFCSSQCAIDKYPNDRVEYYTPTQQSSNNHSNLEKENQDLRQQLTEVQKQLVEVLAELKKLKSNINGQDSEKLNQQIAHNEKLIKNGENISVNEVQEQVQKSEALMKEFNATTVVPTKDNKAQYIIGGSVLVALMAIIGYFLVKKHKRK
jgi:predicted RNase H-like nuclease (RuvC/YqgF family)